MRVEHLFPSKYVSAIDLPRERDVEVTIADVEMVTFNEDGESSEKPALRFNGTHKRLLLNRENCGRISRMFGPETDNWIGRPVRLFVDQVSFRGKLVDAVRVRVVTVSQPPAMATSSDPMTTTTTTSAAPPVGVPAAQTRAAMRNAHEGGDDIPF